MPDRIDPAFRSPAVSGSVAWEPALNEQRAAAAVEFLDGVAATAAIQTVSKLAVERLRTRAGDRVLDLGCGAGAFFPALSAPLGRAGTITGLDHAAALLREAGRHASHDLLPRLVLVRGDAHRLPFGDASFDAAHTERVLMHLEQPAEALAELRRVVRPGGWIVCVEPDLGGIRLDTPDPNWGRALVEGFTASIRNPAIGLILNRLMASVGLIDRSIDPITEVERVYDPDVAEIFAAAAKEAVARGWMTGADAAKALASLNDAERAGCYTSYATMLIVSGRVP